MKKQLFSCMPSSEKMKKTCLFSLLSLSLRSWVLKKRVLCMSFLFYFLSSASLGSSEGH